MILNYQLIYFTKKFSSKTLLCLSFAIVTKKFVKKDIFNTSLYLNLYLLQSKISLYFANFKIYNTIHY